MAWSKAALSSDYQSRATAGYPIMIYNNVLDDVDSIVWKNSSFAADTDSDYPTSNLYDDTLYTLSKPATSASNNWKYLDFDFSTTPVTFDSIIMVFNISTIGNSDGAYAITIADNSAFSVNNDVICNVNPISGALWSIENNQYYWAVLYNIDAGHYKYSDVPYLRIQFKTGSGINDKVEVNQIYIGERFALPTPPLLPYSVFNSSSQHIIFESDSGVRTQYGLSYGSRMIDAKFKFESDDYADEFTYHLRRMLYYTNYGESPIIWSERPAIMDDDSDADGLIDSKSAHGLHHLMYVNPNMTFVNTEADVYTVGLQMREAGGVLTTKSDPYHWSIFGEGWW